MLKTISLVPNCFTALYTFTSPEKNEELSRKATQIDQVCVQSLWSHYVHCYKVIIIIVYSHAFCVHVSM